MKRDLFASEHPLQPCSYQDWKNNLQHQNRFPNFKPFFQPDFEGFLNVLIDRGLVVGLKTPLQGYVWSQDREKHEKGPSVFLSHDCLTGGTGSDDGGETIHRWQETAIDSSNPPLRQLLQIFWPDVSTQDANDLSRLVCSDVRWTVNEYYGDSSDYLSQITDLEKVFLVLKAENKLMPQETERSVSRFEKHLQSSSKDPLCAITPPKMKP